MDANLPKGLATSHFGIINHLIRVGDGKTPLQLARAFQVPKTTMTHTLAGLEKHGLIEMRPNERDARSKCVWLTQKSEEFRDQTIKKLRPKMVNIMAQFPAEKIASLVGDLAEIRKVLDENRDEYLN